MPAAHLLALAPLGLVNRRSDRYGGGGLGVPLDRLAPDDRALVRAVYAAVMAIAAARPGPDWPGRSAADPEFVARVAAAAADGFVRDAQRLGEATVRAGADAPTPWAPPPDSPAPPQPPARRNAPDRRPAAAENRGLGGAAVIPVACAERDERRSIGASRLYARGEGPMTGKQIGGIACLALAGLLLVSGISSLARNDGPALSDPSGLGVSRAVGSLLLVAIVGLWLLTKPAAKRPTRRRDEDVEERPPHRRR